MTNTNPDLQTSQTAYETLAERIRNGENIPLAELIEFIKHSDGVLRREKKAKTTPDKDVDFF